MGLGTRLSASITALLGTAAAAQNPWLEQEFQVLQNGTYIFNLLVGTPGQQVTVDIDYGSADLWIHEGPNPCATGCDPDALYPTFNPNTSETYESNQSYTLGVRASDGSYVAQSWAWDDLQIAGTNISHAVLAVGLPNHRSTLPTQTDRSEQRNLLGLGPRGLEACVLTTANGHPFPTYDNLVAQLKRDNITRSASFSIWVDPLSKTYGKLLLGAEDTSLYTGSLDSAPIVNYPNLFEPLDEPMYLGVPLNGMALQVNGQYGGPNSFEGTLLYSQTVAILNSRTNFTLPQAWLSALGTALGGVWSERLALYLVTCDLTGTISLYISNSQLQAPLENFIQPAAGVLDALGQPVCVLQIRLANDVYLSNQFLQNYYVVVDYDAEEISFGTPAAATRAASVAPPEPTTTFKGQNTLEAALDTDIITLWLSETVSNLVVPSSVTKELILGGEPQPTRITGSMQLNSRLLPKATDASNNAAPRVGEARACAGGVLAWLLMLL